MIERIKLWHGEACEELAELCRRYGLRVDRPPTMETAVTASATLAYYRPSTHRCYYGIAHAAIDGDNYRATVRHEVAHAYRQLLAIDAAWPRVVGDSHDEWWRKLMVDIGESPAARCRAPTLGKLMSVMERLQR